MGKAINSQIDEKYDYENDEAKYYDSAELDYYKPDTFNQPDNSPNAYYVQNPKEYECQYCESRFSSNNKLYNHLRGSCKRQSEYLIPQNKDTAFALNITISPPTILQSKDSESLQSIAFKDIPIAHSSISPSTDIGTGYGFRGYHYLKDRVVLSLSLL